MEVDADVGEGGGHAGESEPDSPSKTVTMGEAPSSPHHVSKRKGPATPTSSTPADDGGDRRHPGLSNLSAPPPFDDTTAALSAGAPSLATPTEMASQVQPQCSVLDARYLPALRPRRNSRSPTPTPATAAPLQQAAMDAASRDWSEGIERIHAACERAMRADQTIKTVLRGDDSRKKSADLTAVRAGRFGFTSWKSTGQVGACRGLCNAGSPSIARCRHGGPYLYSRLVVCRRLRASRCCKAKTRSSRWRRVGARRSA